MPELPLIYYFCAISALLIKINIHCIEKTFIILRFFPTLVCKKLEKVIIKILLLLGGRKGGNLIPFSFVWNLTIFLLFLINLRLKKYPSCKHHIKYKDIVKHCNFNVPSIIIIKLLEFCENIENYQNCENGEFSGESNKEARNTEMLQRHLHTFPIIFINFY